MPVVSSLMTQNMPVAWATLTGTRRVVGGGRGCTACVVMELPFARGGAPSPDRRLQRRRAVGSHPSTKQGCRSARSSGVLPQQALATTPVGVPSGCTSLFGTMTAHPGPEQSRRHRRRPGRGSLVALTALACRVLASSESRNAGSRAWRARRPVDVLMQRGVFR